jgi:hypothetical protein
MPPRRSCCGLARRRRPAPGVVMSSAVNSPDPHLTNTRRSRATTPARSSR